LTGSGVGLAYVQPTMHNHLHEVKDWRHGQVWSITNAHRTAICSGGRIAAGGERRREGSATLWTNTRSGRRFLDEGRAVRAHARPLLQLSRAESWQHGGAAMCLLRHVVSWPCSWLATELGRLQIRHEAEHRMCCAARADRRSVAAPARQCRRAETRNGHGEAINPMCTAEPSVPSAPCRSKRVKVVSARVGPEAYSGGTQ